MRTDKNGNHWAKHNQTYTRVIKDSVSNVRKMVEDPPPIEDEIKQSVKDRILSETSAETINKVRDYANNLIKKPTD